MSLIPNSSVWKNSDNIHELVFEVEIHFDSKWLLNCRIKDKIKHLSSYFSEIKPKQNKTAFQQNANISLKSNEEE